MRAWYIFWSVSFAVSALSFVAIATVVAVKGVADLRHMLAALKRGDNNS